MDARTTILADSLTSAISRTVVGPPMPGTKRAHSLGLKNVRIRIDREHSQLWSRRKILIVICSRQVYITAMVDYVGRS